MDLSTWEKRRQLLIDFQGALIAKFPEENYNVFVFGSYITNRFRQNESDIDLIVYADTDKRIFDIARWTSAFFANTGLPSDVLEYTDMPKAHVILFGILNSIKMTDYYPQKLEDDLFKMWKDYTYIEKPAMANKKKYQRWEHIIRMDEIGKEKSYG